MLIIRSLLLFAIICLILVFILIILRILCSHCHERESLGILSEVMVVFIIRICNMPCTVKMTILIWLYLWSLQLLLCCSWHICSIIVINLPGVSTISPSITILKLINYPKERNLRVQCSPVEAGGLNFICQSFSPWFFKFPPSLIMNLSW